MYQTVKYILSLILVLFLCTKVLSQNNQLEEQQIENSTTNFAVKLFKLFYQPSEKNGNVLFSPINIYTALALVDLGSNGTTRTEVGNLLEFSSTNENQVQQNHKTLSQILKKIENTTKLQTYDDDFIPTEKKITFINIAAGIFVQKGIDLQPTYICEVQSYYEAEVANLDFINEPSQSTDTINQYVSNNTNGKIPTVLTQPVDTDTRIILASVLYFKASWKDVFPESATQDANFQTGSQTIKVKMMSRTNYIPYLNLPSLKAKSVNLQYAGDDTSMWIILPNAGQSIDNLIKSLDTATLQGIIPKFESTYIALKLPRFGYKFSKNIVPTLQSLGVQQVFTNKADLSNLILTDIKLKIAQITHSTEIQVNENGTEASAVTIVQFHATAIIQDPIPINFTVNKPFVFFIHHRQTNTILFLGSVKNPNGN